MNSLVREFFKVGNGEAPHFQEVIFLSETKLSWEEISKRAPDLPRGWFELSYLPTEDRIEFTRDFWLDRLSFNPAAYPLFLEFFDRLDDVGVVLSRTREDEPLASEIVYSLKESGSFFRGQPPAEERELQELKREIPLTFPRDYLRFFKIHNGFGKLSEMGLLKVEDIVEAKERVAELLLKTTHSVRSNGKLVDPSALLPFYEAIGLSSYQCFYADWYPGSEMGNVYLSGIDYTISDTTEKKAWAENLAFATFSEWLAYYLQGMNVSP